MRQTFTLALPSAVTAAAAITASKRGMNLPDGSAAAALQVDNRSGFWLQVYPAAGLPIAPYTLGAVVAFVTPAPSVDALFMATGPAGQLSTLAGDPVTVTLYDADEAPAASEGVPFVEAFTPVLTISNVSIPIPFSSGQPLGLNVAGIAGKRIRVLTWSFAIDQTARNLGYPSDGGVLAELISNGIAVDSMLLNPGKPSESHLYGTGLDLLTGIGFTVGASAVWCDMAGASTATYVVI